MCIQMWPHTNVNKWNRVTGEGQCLRVGLAGFRIVPDRQVADVPFRMKNDYTDGHEGRYADITNIYLIRKTYR